MEASSETRFAADRMLARLARWLRLCGADVVFQKGLGGGELLKEARMEGRIVLTRDKRLRTASDVHYLESERVREQLAQVIKRFRIDIDAAFTRCSRCNATLREVNKVTVRNRVPPYVYDTQERFSQCPDCGRLYWRATHPERILAQLQRIQESAGSPPDSSRTSQ